MEACGTEHIIPEPTSEEGLLYEALTCLVKATLCIFKDIQKCKDCEESQSPCCEPHERLVETVMAAKEVHDLWKQRKELENNTTEEMSPDSREE